METSPYDVETRPSADCLNRTMQYGNCFFKRVIKKNIDQFKSYYVVWKPERGKIKGKNSICLNRTMQYGNNIEKNGQHREKILFKSYYVVWKLHITLTISHAANGLNRTMQYGNKSA